MKDNVTLLTKGLLVWILVTWCTGIMGQSSPNITGSWKGHLVAQGQILDMEFEIKPDSANNPVAYLNVPAQNLHGFQVPSLRVTPDSLILSIPQFFASYRGVIKSESRIEGIWSQGGQNLPLILGKGKDLVSLIRPQEPKKPYPYRELMVSFFNVKDKVGLAGTLTVPREEGRYPAVILISGSGAQNRDEEVFGHKPFLVWADYLTRKGFAVLRFDDRGVGLSSGNRSEATSEGFARDVQAAYHFLKTRPEIDTTRIGLMGHSEGGLIASLLAVWEPQIAYMVLLAGPGVRGVELLKRQNELLLQASGAPDTVVEVVIKMLDIAEKNLQRVEHPSYVFNDMMEEFTSLTEGVKPEDLKRFGLTSEHLKMQAHQMMNPWMRYFLFTDPQDYLKKAQCPVLALNGELDKQVDPKQNLPGIEKALSEGGNANYKIKEFPGLNHLFQTSQKGNVDEYVSISETVAPEVLEYVSDWLMLQVKE